MVSCIVDLLKSVSSSVAVTLEDKDPKTLWLADPRSLVARWLAQFDQSFDASMGFFECFHYAPYMKNDVNAYCKWPLKTHENLIPSAFHHQGKRSGLKAR